jgi:hypothetical protein
MVSPGLPGLILMKTKSVITAVLLVFWMAPDFFLLYHVLVDWPSGDLKGVDGPMRAFGRFYDRSIETEAIWLDWHSFNALCCAIVLLPPLCLAVTRERRSRLHPRTLYYGKCFVVFISISIVSYLTKITLAASW